MHELEIEAKIDNLTEVLAFVEEKLHEIGCDEAKMIQIDIAVEEIFVNIAHYAYNPKIGYAQIKVDVIPDPLQVCLTFIDHGMPYDPLAREDPDINLPLEERKIGGLGIFMVKNSMEDLQYEYKDGMNILSFKKSI
ncbi:MAG: ATP-binding protein [Lachnospiraceae bacterium]|nr:ATP-binding protein [Lachnospiraceae bacterium]